MRKGTQLCLLVLPFITANLAFSQISPYDELIKAGKHFFEENKVDSALSYFQSAYRLDSSIVEAPYYIGGCYSWICLESSILSNCWKGVEWLNKADSMEVGYKYLYELRGDCKEKLKDYYGAVEDYEKALNQSFDLDLLNHKTGILYTQLQEYDRALKDLDKVIELNPSEPYYFANRALIYRELSEFDKALRDHDQAIALAPDSAVFYTDKALTLIEVERFQEAIPLYNQVIRLRPNDANGYHNRGGAKYLLEDYHGALFDLNTAIRLDSLSFDSFYQRGMIKRKLGRDGCEDFRKCMTLIGVSSDKINLFTIRDAFQHAMECKN